jgi:hypothetical protein
VAAGAVVFGLQTSARERRSALPAALRAADEVPVRPVEAEMRNIAYHSAGAVLGIKHLRGLLRPTVATAPPWFEDPESFRIAVDSAEVSLTPGNLATLLNEHVFAYPGSPLKQIRIEAAGGELIQRGKLHHLSFSIKALLSATADGRLRLHPTSMKVFGISVKGLMNLFGLELDDLMKVGRERGVVVDDNDVILSPSGLLPPPLIEGRVTSVRVTDGLIVTTFGRSGRAGAPPPLRPVDPTAENYMLFQGGRLRFGKLLMVDSDLEIVDVDPSDPFDFNLAELDRQLVAGHTHNQPDFGLLTIIPDYADLRRAPAAHPR